MTVPAAPIPSLRALCLAAVGASRDSLHNWLGAKDDRLVEFYSAARFALSGGIARAIERRGKRPGIVWLPDYICDEAVAPLRAQPSLVRFYPIRKDLSPDWERLYADAAGAGAPDVFILVHYFGVPNSVSEARAFCATVGAELIEDCAHVLVPAGGCGEATAVFSPRKLLPLPEGGLLVTRGPDGGSGAAAPFASNKAFVAKWVARRMAQKLMLGMGISWHRAPASDKALPDRTGPPASERVTPRPDRYSLRLLGLIAKDLDSVIRRRRDNYFRLLRAIAGSGKMTPLFPSLADGICPYALPLIVPEGRGALNARLQSRGIPASDWPNLPAEVLAAPADHPVAIQIQSHILLLPVHQDLSDSQIEVIADELRSFSAMRAA